MDQEYIGVIREFAGPWLPKNFLPCDGRLLAIAQNQALYAILGLKYGGDGIRTFALPDLRGRGANAFGTGANPPLSTRVIGEQGGFETVTLQKSQLPVHRHTYNALSGGADTYTPLGSFVPVFTDTTVPFYANEQSGDQQLQMHPETVMPAGNSQPHQNMQPYIGSNYIICIAGIFPSRG